jgi:hypothetical protein
MLPKDFNPYAMLRNQIVRPVLISVPLFDLGMRFAIYTKTTSNPIEISKLLIESDDPHSRKSSLSGCYLFVFFCQFY